MRATSLCLQTSNQLVTDGLDAVLEILGVLGLPVGLGSRHSILTSETNEENVVSIVSVVTVKVLIREAEIRQRNRGLAGRSTTVGVTPDTIVLGWGIALATPYTQSITTRQKGNKKENIPASHHTQPPSHSAAPCPASGGQSGESVPRCQRPRMGGYWRPGP